MHSGNCKIFEWSRDLSGALVMACGEALSTGRHMQPQEGVAGSLVDDVLGVFACSLLGCSQPKMETRIRSAIVKEGDEFARYIFSLATGWCCPESRVDGLLDSGSWEDAILDACRKDMWGGSNLAVFLLHRILMKRSSHFHDIYGVILEHFQGALGISSGDIPLRLHPTEVCGVWSHLLPFGRIASRHLVLPTPHSLEWVLAQQHDDGFFYPVPGGGACPDLNAANILLLHYELLPSHSVKIRTSLSRLVESIVRKINGPFMPENFRSGQLPARKARNLGPAVSKWVQVKTIQGVDIYKPDLWSTVIRYLTVAKCQEVLTRVHDVDVHEHDHLRIWTPMVFDYGKTSELEP